MSECVDDVGTCPDCGALYDVHEYASRVNYRAIAIEILDELIATRGYVGNYFWDKWFADGYVDFRKRLGVDQ